MIGRGTERIGSDARGWPDGQEQEWARTRPHSTRPVAEAETRIGRSGSVALQKGRMELMIRKRCDKKESDLTLQVAVVEGVVVGRDHE